MKKTFKMLLLIVVCFMCLKVNAKTYDICKNGVLMIMHKMFFMNYNLVLLKKM